MLVCAFENTTVDQTLRNIVMILKSTYGCNKEIVERLVKRIGYRAKIASDIHPFCNHDELARAKIVGTTLHSSSSSSSSSSIALHTRSHRILQDGSFDRIIMDETGQVTPEQGWMPLRLLRQDDDNAAVAVTLYGDDIQLTPISSSLEPETSILRSLRTKNRRLVHMLDTTYRLNYPGVQMTSDIFYQGNLHAPQNIMDRRLVLDDGGSGGPSLH